jgi:hypothetical protein
VILPPLVFPEQAFQNLNIGLRYKRSPNNFNPQLTIMFLLIRHLYSIPGMCQVITAMVCVHFQHCVQPGQPGQPWQPVQPGDPGKPGQPTSAERPGHCMHQITLRGFKIS